MTGGTEEGELAPATRAAWALVRQMLDDMTSVVAEDAETEMELVEGLRVVARVTALCSELSLDVDPAAPWFFPMNSEARYVGGPNPDGEYHLAMIDGRHRYRVSGDRGSVVYLGFQVLAGRGLTPRRMAAHLSDSDLDVDASGDRAGRFAFVLSATEPTAAELAGDAWVEIPDDASAIVVRQYVADRDTEVPATLRIDALDPPGRPERPTDEVVGEQLTAMAWTIAKLSTLHRTIDPGIGSPPNQLVTASAAQIGAADTTPDNLYMLGTFRLGDGQALVIDVVPPATRYWSVTVENIWHECIDVRRRPSSLTGAHATADADGHVRVVVAADDPGVDNWVDTGGRHRGFVILRWLDDPEAPAVSTAVVDVATIGAGR